MIRQKELLKKLHISRQTLWRWRRAGMPYHRVGNTLFFDEKQVKAWIKCGGDKRVT